MKENKVGRPKKIDEMVLGKLEHGFMQGMSDREACLYANINPSTLYDYCKENPDFSERKELLKEQLKIQAKLNISNKITNGDVHLSQWYLERRARDEFGYKQEIQHSGEMTTKQEVKHDLSKLTVEELRQFESLLSKSNGS